MNKWGKALAVSPIACVIIEAVLKWSENHQFRYHPCVYEVLFCICMVGLIFDMMLLIIWLRNKSNDFWYGNRCDKQQGIGCSDASDDLEEKREHLRKFKDSAAEMEKTNRENEKILRSSMTVDEAYALFKSGRATEKEFLEYKNGRETIEAAVRMYPSMMESTNQAIRKLEAEVEALEEKVRNPLGIQHYKVRNPFISAVRTVGGAIVGLIVWMVVLQLSAIIIALLGSVPVIGWILYWPSDAGWAQMVLPPTCAVPVGAMCSAAISGGAKAYSCIIIGIYVLDVIILLAGGSFTFSSFLIAASSIMCAALAFHLDGDAMKQWRN